MCQPHELIPPSCWDPCIQSFTWSSYIRSLRSHWSLLGPDGKDSEGRTWVHWIVHQKWPVQCANLMNSTLLVTATMHSKFYLGLASSKGEKWLKMTVSARRKRLRESDMAPLDSSWKVASLLYNLMSSFLLVTAIHVFKVLPSPHTFAFLGVTDLCLDQMGKI